MMVKKSSQLQANAINKRRNKDNLWYMHHLFHTCPSMYALMFEVINLSTYKNNTTNSIQQKQKSKKKNKTNCGNGICFVLDKFDNLVYKDGIYYGTYKIAQYDSTTNNNGNNNINNNDLIEIYNSCHEHKYTINMKDQSYKEICDIFHHYQAVIMEEHHMLMDEIDENLEELFNLMEHKIEPNSQAHTKIRNKLRNIIEKMYNSKIDLTTESYDKINNFMKKFDSECV